LSQSPSKTDRNCIHYHAPRDLGCEVVVVLCLSGPASEILFCGQIDDRGDEIDFQMAPQILARYFDPLRAAAELARCHEIASNINREFPGVASHEPNFSSRPQTVH
jgi:hypothetical protein